MPKVHELVRMKLTRLGLGATRLGLGATRLGLGAFIDKGLALTPVLNAPSFHTSVALSPVF